VYEEIKKQAIKNKLALYILLHGEQALINVGKHIGMHSCESNINSYIMNLNK
jgi:hypothetical protein